MEQSWQDVAPPEAASREDVLDTGKEAFLRTKQILDEAATVSSMLFIDEEDMADRYRRAYAKQEGEEAMETEPSVIGTREISVGGHPPDATSIFKTGLFGGATDSSVRADGTAGALTTSSRLPLEEPVERRPEERKFCELFIDLLELKKTVPAGDGIPLDLIRPILLKLRAVVDEARADSEETLFRLRELQGPASPAVAVAAATTHELSLEYDTWSLMEILNAADQLDAEFRLIRREAVSGARNAQVEPPPFEPYPGPDASDEEVLLGLWRRDWEYRRADAVVEWLQETASHRLEASGALCPGFVGREGRGGVGWSRTLEGLGAGGSGGEEVLQMHPDGNVEKLGGDSDTRGVKVLRLLGQDDLDEEELLRTIWKLVRAGRIREAKDMCKDAGQPWRAAAMSGGAVVGCRREGSGFEDGAIFSPGQGLWQDICWEMSASLAGGVSVCEGPAQSVARHEASVFAHLAGNSQYLLGSDVCHTWEDEAWVRFCSLLNRKILKERIRHRRVQAARSALYPGVRTLGTDEALLERMEQGEPPSTHTSIFSALDDNANARVISEGRGVYRQTQEALVLGATNIPDLIERILKLAIRPLKFGFASEEEREVSPQKLRFATHIALILAAQFPYLTRLDDTQAAIDDLVSAYAEHLAETQQIGLVAVYAATLPMSRRRELYASFLRTVVGERYRHEALEQAKRYMASDMPAILQKVVEDTRAKTLSLAPPAPKQVPGGDLEKIRAISWLLRDASTRPAAVCQANSLARHLLLQKYDHSGVNVKGSGRESAALPWETVSGTDVGAGGAGGIGGVGAGAGAGGSGDGHESPVVLSARVQAIGLLLGTVPLARSSEDRDEEEEEEEGEKGGGRTGEGRRGDGGLGSGSESVVVGEDAAREQECWRMLLNARQAYLGWTSACCARQQRRASSAGGSRADGTPTGAMAESDGGGAANGESDAAMVHSAAMEATEAIDRILTYEDGWMSPVQQEDGQRFKVGNGAISLRTSRGEVFGAAGSGTGGRGLVSNGGTFPGPVSDSNLFGAGSIGTNNGRFGGFGGFARPVDMGDGAFVFGSSAPGDARVFSGYALEERDDDEDEEQWAVREKQRAEAVVGVVERRDSRERERVDVATESARLRGVSHRKEELRRVREACLPGLVFLYHEIFLFQLKVVYYHHASIEEVLKI